MRNNIQMSEAWTRAMEYGDEFIIIASGPGKETRAWGRDKLQTAKFIADQIIEKHGFDFVQVYNVFGGHVSSPLYEATPKSLGIALPRFEREEVV